MSEAAWITAGLKVLEQRWKKSGDTDTDALLGALVFCRLQLPPWVFKGLWDRLLRQLPQDPPPYHALRWFMVREGLRETGTLEGGFAYASEKLAHTPARGGPKAMERSYYLVEHHEPVARHVRRYTRRRKA